ncbi:MAG: membrane protein insertion efficiency factor YidD [Planctomycetota bacterium]
MAKPFSRFPGWARWIISLPALALVAAVRVYQYAISPLIGPHCRFEPSCSQYFIEAVRKYGALRGAAKGIWRICRCHPWGPSGYDPP